MKESEVLSNLLLDGFVEENNIGASIKLFLYRFLKFWWLFVISIILCVSLAFAYLFFATPEYMIGSSILVKIDQGAAFTQNIVLSDLEGFETSKQVDNEIEIIRSYSLMKEAIERLPLHASYFVEDEFGRRSELYGYQAPIQLNLHEKNTSQFEIPEDNTILVTLRNEDFLLWRSEEDYQQFKYGEKIENWYGVFSIENNPDIYLEEPYDLIISLNNKEVIAGIYHGKLNVNVSNKLASVLILSFTDPVPQKGVEVLNKLVEMYNFQAVKEKNVIAENTISFIDNQLSTLDQELNEVENKIEEYKRTNNISNLSSEFNSFVQNTGFYETQLSRNKIQLEVLGSIEQYVENPSENEVPSSLTIADATLSDLISRYNEMQREIKRVKRNVQPSSPVLLGMIEDVNSLKRDIGSMLTNVRQSLVIENRNLNESLGQIEGRMSRIPEIERELLEMTRDQDRMQENYIYLRGKKEQSELSLAANTVANARIIDYASSSGSPTKPKRVIILGISLFFGLGLPFLFVYGSHMLNQQIQQKSDVSRVTNTPILGEITHNKGQLDLVVKKGDRSPIAEQFRLLRSNLAFSNSGNKNQVIMVTSSSAGEGKSFFSLNLGSSISFSRKDVCIIEFDLRRPALLKKANIDSNIGISDYLINPDIAIEDIISQSGVNGNLFVIGAGKIVDDPAELLMSERLQHLFYYLKERFDYIILDTAPIGTVSDAFSLSTYVDICLYIVRYNRTTKEQLNFVQDVNLRDRFKNLYIVLNDAKGMNSYYGYGYGYGYDHKR